MEYGPVVTQFGFGGALIFVVLRGFEMILRTLLDINHTLKGLGMAIWTDLAVRPYVDEATRARANMAIQKMEARDSGK